MLRDHGQGRKYHHDAIGWNARMDGIQAAVLDLKLTRPDRANDLRRQHAARYRDRLQHADDIILPQTASYAQHVYHIYAVRVPERDRVLADLAARDIHCGIHYPIPVHLQSAYRHLGLGPESFPVAERCADEFLSLPMFPELTADQIDAVADALQETLGAQSTEDSEQTGVRMADSGLKG